MKLKTKSSKLKVWNLVFGSYLSRLYYIFKIVAGSRKTGIIVSWLLVILASGCAKTVTTEINFGSQLSVEVTLGGNLDVINNRYFLVLSTDETFNIPLPPPNSLDEFLSVGDLPQQGSPESYYDKYYSTWSGYIEVNNLGYHLVKGPFDINTTPSSITLKTMDEITSKISFSFRLDQIFGSAVPQHIYFDFVTVKYPLNDYKRAKDLLYPPKRYFPSASGSELSGSYEPNEGLDPSLDILNWKVIIQ